MSVELLRRLTERWDETTGLIFADWLEENRMMFAAELLRGKVSVEHRKLIMALAIVAGVIQAADHGGAFHPLAALWILAKAVLFLGAALVVGRWASRRTFRIAARRADKRFPMPSPEVERILGRLVQERTGWPVDLSNPALKIHVEILTDEGVGTLIRSK